MKIVLATKNLHKIEEIQHAIENFGIELLSLLDFPNMPDVVEDGLCLEENSLKKAKEISIFTGFTALADDTGLEVDALGGAPGVFSARYAGIEADYSANNIKLLKEIQQIAHPWRTARFRCVMTLYGQNILEVAEGRLEGHIIDNNKGKNGFGYDPIFVPKGYTITLAEMSMEEKNAISHRGQAVNKMAVIIKKLIKNNK